MTYHCHQSGKCCQTFDLQVSREELAQMQQAGPTFRPLTVTPDVDGKTLIVQAPCPWYQDGCTIYESRPAVCRAYLCFRKRAEDPFRGPQEQHAFLEANPDARAQAQGNRRAAMVYAKAHGWEHLDLS